MQNATSFRLRPLIAAVLTGLVSTAIPSVAGAADAANAAKDKKNPPAQNTPKNQTTATKKTSQAKETEQRSAVNNVLNKGVEQATSKDGKTPTDPQAANIKTTNDPAQPVNPDHGKYTDQYVKDYFSNTGVLPGTPLMAMPQKFRRSAGRYGEFRSRSSGDGYHAGLDMTPGDSGRQMKAPAGGTVAVADYLGAAGNVVTVRRPNGDKYQFFHLANSLKKSNPVGSNVVQGMPLGVVGGTGGNYAIHLHLEYILPSGHTKRWRNAWLARENASRFSLYNKSGISASGSGLKTDPTPYLAEDLPVKPDNYSPWLGTTIRQQFNALYNTKLPLGPGAASNLRPLPAMPRYEDGVQWTPEELAAARAALVKGAEFADWSGYTGAFDASGISYQAMATIFSASDGEDFGSLPQPPTPISLETMTPRQIVEQVAMQRYGNTEWQDAMLKLSSKGLLTEYTMMTATENYLSQQNQMLYNRIEMLLAGITQARLFEFNKKIEAMQVEAEASVVPSILDIDLVDLGYSDGGAGPTVDLANLPGEIGALLDVLKEAISHGEGRYNSYNTGTRGGCKLRGFVSDKAAAATGTPLVTTMTPRQIYKSAYKVSNCNLTRKFASGKYQITYYSLAGDSGFGTGGFIKAFPQYADVPMTPEMQENMAKQYLILKKRPVLADFILYGKGTIDDAMWDMAKEWASIAVPAGKTIKGGKIVSNGAMSFYESKNNHANKQSTAMARAVLVKMGEWHKANPGKAKAIIDGKAPDISINAPKADAGAPNATGGAAAPANGSATTAPKGTEATKGSGTAAKGTTTDKNKSGSNTTKPAATK